MAISRYGKAVVQSVGMSLLNPLSFLCGIVIAADKDEVWRSEIAQLLTSDAREQIKAAARKAGIDLTADYRPIDTKMPVAEDLRTAIGNNSRKSMLTLVQELMQANLASDQ